MPNSSNIADVISWLGNWVDSFDFKRPGFDQSLGRNIANKAVERIGTRSLTEKRRADMFGSVDWPANSTTPSHWAPKGYAQYKEDHYGVVGMPHVPTGQMLSQKSCTVARHRAESRHPEIWY